MKKFLTVVVSVLIAVYLVVAWEWGVQMAMATIVSGVLILLMGGAFLGGMVNSPPPREKRRKKHSRQGVHSN